MAVVRVNKTSDFTVMSNAHFREREMSLKAKGLLSLMLSLPDEWDYSVSGLSTLSKDGKGSITNTLMELESMGYVKRTLAHDEKGRFAGYDYDVYEHPLTKKPLTENPSTEKPLTEKPLTENQPQLNTNTLNPKGIKKECIKDVVVSAETRDIGNEDEKLSLLKGEWQGLMLSDKQMDDLIDRMGIEVFEEYAKRMSAFIERTGARGFNHHRKMLQWYAQDTQI
jgi:hypothetical protein